MVGLSQSILRLYFAVGHAGLAASLADQQGFILGAFVVIASPSSYQEDDSLRSRFNGSSTGYTRLC